MLLAFVMKYGREIRIYVVAMVIESKKEESIKDRQLHNKVEDSDDAGADHTGQDDIVPVLPRLNLANQLSDTRQLCRHVVDPLIDAKQC